jgi:hypothetical protein
MVSLEIPIPEIPVDRDPYYDARHHLVEAQGNGQPIISAGGRAIGILANRAAFSSVQVPGLNMPEMSLDFNRDNSYVRYYIPDKLAAFQEAIEIAARYEHSRYPDAVYVFDKVILAADQTMTKPGFAQRGDQDGKVHRDCGWEDWVHLYVVSDSNPTEFFEADKPGIAGGHGAPVPAPTLSDPYVPLPHEVAFANSTSLHRSPVIPEGGDRTFLRLMYVHDLGK